MRFYFVWAALLLVTLGACSTSQRVAGGCEEPILQEASTATAVFQMKWNYYNLCARLYILGQRDNGEVDVIYQTDHVPFGPPAKTARYVAQKRDNELVWQTPNGTFRYLISKSEAYYGSGNQWRATVIQVQGERFVSVR